MRLLDLFCGAGGGAVGYHRAGFEVVGVDHKPQPSYPFALIVADALSIGWSGFDAIHASPPCGRFTNARNADGLGEWYPDLVPATRAQLIASGLPFVIENVVGAPLIEPVMLCGTAFGLGADGFELRRHRLFETSFPFLSPGCWHRYPAIPVYGDGPNADFYRRNGRGFGVELRREAMGIEWTNRNELSLAIPPAFTEYVGQYLADAVRRAAPPVPA